LCLKGSSSEMVLSSGKPLWPLLLRAPADRVAEGEVTGIGQEASGERHVPIAPTFVQHVS